MKNLIHKKAFITGGSRGIGAAIVEKLAENGAEVFFTYHASTEKAEELAEKIRRKGGSTGILQADNADPEAVIQAVHKAAKAMKGLDIIVNNAGIGLYNDVHALTIEDFDRIMSVNVRAVFAASKAALDHLKSGGRIINIGSCQAERMPGPGGVLYAMSKSALTGLTKGMARDLGPQNITVNIVHPGPIDTDMNPAGGPFADHQRSLMALSEFGKTEDVANLVAFLASEESRYITGAGLVIDGGTNI